MHPCCWGNLIQGLVQVLPLLAVVLMGGKKIIGAIRQSLLVQRHRAIKSNCCCPQKDATTAAVAQPKSSLARVD